MVLSLQVEQLFGHLLPERLVLCDFHNTVFDHLQRECRQDGLLYQVCRQYNEIYDRVITVVYADRNETENDIAVPPATEKCLLTGARSQISRNRRIRLC